MSPAHPSRRRHQWRRFYAVVGLVDVAAYLAARLLVLAALGAAHLYVDWHHVHDPALLYRLHQGLLGWDAGWYSSIAAHGYAAAGPGSLRFFPLMPLLTRAVAVLPGVDTGAALLVVANAGALAACLLMRRLVLLETGDEAAGRRAVWLLCLFPIAFVLVMGYAEPLFIALSLWSLWAWRTGHRGRAALGGFLAGLARPAGALLVVPALVEAGRGWRAAATGERLPRLAAAAAPAAGSASYLGWCQLTGRGFLTPFREQLSGSLRGGLSDPFPSFGHDARLLFSGHHLGTALHLPWAIVCAALLVVAFRRLPSCYGWYGAATLVVALTASNLDSFERYAFGSLVPVLALVTLTSRDLVYRLVLGLSAIGLVAYAALAFVNAYVP